MLLAAQSSHPVCVCVYVCVCVCVCVCDMYNFCIIIMQVLEHLSKLEEGR